MPSTAKPVQIFAADVAACKPGQQRIPDTIKKYCQKYDGGCHQWVQVKVDLGNDKSDPHHLNQNRSKNRSGQDSAHSAEKTRPAQDCCSNRIERISFPIDILRRKELTLINVRRQNDCTQKAIDLIASGKIHVDFMITHRFELEQVQQAFDMVARYSDGVIKALIEI